MAESRILAAAPADTRPRTPLISFCTVQLRTLCAAHSLGLSVSLRPQVQALGCCPASGAPWSSATPRSLERGRGSNKNNMKEVTLWLLTPLITKIFFVMSSLEMISTLDFRRARLNINHYQINSCVCLDGATITCSSGCALTTRKIRLNTIQLNILRCAFDNSSPR